MSTIMVVDDMAIFREPIAAVLRQKGYVTMCAGNGNEALDLLCEQRPDLILLDVAMPVLDGIGFLRVMRKNALTRHIPVILLTAVAEKDYVLRAKELGVQGYLLKSRFSLEELLARVQEALDQPVESLATAPTEQPEHRTESVASPCESFPPQTPSPAQPVGRNRGDVGTVCAVAKPPARPIAASHPERARGDLAKETCPPSSAPRKRIHIEDIAQVKALPFVVGQVLALTASRGSTTEDLCGTLAEDVALAGKVLGVANSSLYRGAGRRVMSLEGAVKTIGFDAVRQIAISIGVLDTLGKDGAAVIDTNALWRHSFACACLARWLAEETDGVEPTQAYVGGLLHDMGKFIFAEFLADQLRDAMGQPAAMEAASSSTERDALGSDHATIAADVLRHWGIPAELYAPIKDHHRAEIGGDVSQRRLAHILQVADGLALALGWPSGCLDYFPPLHNRLIEELPILKGLDHESLRSTVADQTREAALLMGMYAHLSVGEKPSEENQPDGPRISYVTDDAEELDMIGLWLKHAQGGEPARQELADATPGAADMIVLSSSTPGRSKAKRIAELVEGGGGRVVVVSVRWRKFLGDVNFDGWRLLEAPVCVQALEAALSELRG